MSLTRRGFFAQIGAIAVGSVLATRPQFNSRMWWIRPPTFEHREFYGLVTVTDKLLRDSAINGGDAMKAALNEVLDDMQRTFDRRCYELIVKDMNASLLSGHGNTPKGFLHGA